MHPPVSPLSFTHERGRKHIPHHVRPSGRYLSAHVSQQDANERTRRAHFRAIAALEGISGADSPTDASPRPISSSHDLTAPALNPWSNSASPMLLSPTRLAEDGKVTPSKIENRKFGSRSLPSRRRQGGGSGDALSLSSPALSLGVNAGETGAAAAAELGVGTVTDAESAGEVAERMSMKQLRELEKSLGMDEAKVIFLAEFTCLCVASGSAVSKGGGCPAFNV